ncbi:MAG: hypothetical protein KKE44_24540 [Proteobacteria bacterium]|nr:hypothetical protein [Pseudomonadota bacterium]MBU1585902.1 hypothetical protein [Pseudomonadota bacterium]MBU2453425.1 hypothetical protein [Pseudomonadota bacterium]MBU2627194.1 hypothetical protein [Pseudomonadota bacterium]
MGSDSNGIHHQSQKKIRARIVASLEKEFGMSETSGLQIDFGSHTDTWLSIPASLSKKDISDQKILAAIEKGIGFKVKQGAFIRFADDQQGSDIWLSIPSKFIGNELSIEEIQVVEGKSLMIRWNIVPGQFKGEDETKDLMQIGFGIFPATFFK